MGILTLIKSWFGNSSSVQAPVKTVVEEKKQEEVTITTAVPTVTTQPNVTTTTPKAYCFKCRSKVDIQNPMDKITKNGKVGIQGTCPNCGAKVFKLGKA